MAAHTNGLLSVVIPSHVRADLLRLCLASVARYAPPGTEVIVVDDGSPSGIVTRTAREFADIRVIRHKRALGFCTSANAGIAASTAPVVELLNDDAEVTEGWADAALWWFADERIAAVAPLVLQNDPRRLALGLPPLIDSAGDEYDRGGFARKRGNGQVIGRFPLERGGVFGASACAAFYRRAAILRAGGFPEHFQAYFEDVDLSFRLRRLGLEIVHEPTSVVWHRVSASYGRRPSRRVLELQSCNEERVFWRNVRGAELVRSLPRHAAVLAAKAIRRLRDHTILPWILGRFRAMLVGPAGSSLESSCILEDGLERTCPVLVSPPRIVANGSAHAAECV
jgi:GT2 family glycosyltransferase